MKNKRLTVPIEGREALPIRAIPYVTGWKLSPDEVAKHLARKIGPPFAQLRNISAYHIQAGSPVQILPKEWDAVVAQHAGLEAKLRAKFPGVTGDDEDPQGYAAWRNKAVTVLPAGVFVWLDEFVRDFREDVEPERITYPHERSGERELVLSPMLPNGVREVVLEGFEVDVRHEPTDAEAEPAPPASTAADDEPSSARKHNVTRNVIIGTFRVKPKDADNAKFWDDKLADPPNWLRAARTSSGKRGVSALWDPLLVAHALLGKKHMTPKTLDKVMREQFPNQYDEWLAGTRDVDR